LADYKGGVLPAREWRLVFNYAVIVVVCDPEIAGVVGSDVLWNAQSVLRGTARRARVRKVGLTEHEIGILPVAEASSAMFEAEHAAVLKIRHPEDARRFLEEQSDRLKHAVLGAARGATGEVRLPQDQAFRLTIRKRFPEADYAVGDFIRYVQTSGLYR
jgi:hypothetical protein